MDGQAVIKVVFGQRGSGKSVKAAGLTGGKPRVLFYDTLGHDYSDGVIVESLDELRSFWRRCYRKRFRIIYRPLDPQAEFADVCRLVYACGGLSFVVEEVDLFFRAGRCDDAFTQIITRGRHANVELIAVTQAPKGFGSLLRSQAHEWFIFATREPDHIDYFKHRCPGVPTEIYATMERFFYVHYVDGSTQWHLCQDTLDGRVDSRSFAFQPALPPGGFNTLRSGPVERLPSDNSSCLCSAPHDTDSPTAQ